MFVGGHLDCQRASGEVPVSKWVSYYGYAEFFADGPGEFFHELGLRKPPCGRRLRLGIWMRIGMKALGETRNHLKLTRSYATPLDKTDFSTSFSPESSQT